MPAHGGCLNVFGISDWYHSVGIFGIQRLPDAGFQMGQERMGTWRELSSKLVAGFWQLVQCGQRVAEERLAVQAASRLVQRPQSFRIIGVEFKHLSKQPLRDLGSRQIHSVQGAEQSPQVQSSDFQAHPEVGGDFQRGTRGHGPSIAHRRAQIKIRFLAEEPIGDKEDGSQATETIASRSSKAQLSFNTSNRSANSRRAPASLQRMPA